MLWAAQHPIPTDGGKQQEHPQTNSRTPQPSTPSPLSEDAKKKRVDGEKDAPQESKAKKYLEDAFAPANLSNWILAGLGVIGGIMAGITLRVIVKQANHMERQTKILEDSVAVAQKSADAALLNAKALINAERPWLVVRQKRGIPRDQCRIIGINRGDTPAEVCELYYSVEPYNQTSTKQPEPSGWVGAYLPRNAITARDESLPIHEISFKGCGDQIREKPTTIMLAFIEIRYWDTFTDKKRGGIEPHLTRVCFCVDPTSQRLVRYATDWVRNT